MRAKLSVMAKRVLRKYGYPPDKQEKATQTGIILPTEMTGSFTLLLPMLLVCFAAMMVPNLLSNPPIYDSLTRYAVQQRTAQQSGEKKHASGA